MAKSDPLRTAIVALLRGGSAHATLEAAVTGIPFALTGKKPRQAPHTLWELVEHIRIAQWDILEFTRDPEHISPDFPDGYWPPTPAPPSPAAWRRSVAAVQRDAAALRALVSKADLLAPLPHDKTKTVVREALVLADHNAYHLGQLVALRKQLGAWPR